MDHGAEEELPQKEICTNQDIRLNQVFFSLSVSFIFLFGGISKSGLGKTLNDQTAKTMSFYWNATISRIGWLSTVRRFGQVFSLFPPVCIKNY